MMLNIIKSFHEGMVASVRVGSQALKLGMAYCRVIPWHLFTSTFTLMQWYLCGMSNVVRLVSLCW